MAQGILSCRSAILVAYLGILLYHEFLRGSSTEPQVQVEAQQDAFTPGPVHVPSLVLPEATEILGVLGESEPGREATQKTSGNAEKLQQATQVLQNVGEWFGNHEVMATLTEARLESIEKRLETFSRMVDNFSKGLDLTWKQIDFVNKHYTGEVATKLETMMSSVQYFHKQLETLNLQQRTDIDTSQQMTSNFLLVNSRLSKLEERSEEENMGTRRIQFDLEEHLPLLRSMVKEEVRAQRVPDDLDSRMVAVDEATVATINRMGNLEAKVAESERLHAEILSLTDSLIRRDNEINNLTALLLDLVKSVHSTKGSPELPPYQGECRTPYLRVGQLCFATTRTPTPWVHARDACLGSGGQLATPSNLTLFARYLKANNISGEVWVGGSELIWTLDPQPPTTTTLDDDQQQQQTSPVASRPQHGGNIVDDSTLRIANEASNSLVSSKRSSRETGDPEQAQATRQDQCLAVVLRDQVHAVLRQCGDHNIAVCQQSS